MIQTAKFNTTLPAAVTASTNLTLVKCDGPRVFSDASRDPNLPLEVKTDSEKTAQSGRILVQVEDHRVNTDSLSQEHPHYYRANLTITYDPRYAKRTEMEETVATLLSFLLSKESNDSQQNVVRVINGEA